MKALILEQYNHLAYKDVPQPEIGPEEVLIAVGSCGICGSDVHGLDGSTGRRIPPIIMGHEAAGTIAALGSGVREWKEGERVTFDSTIYCRECRYCRRGEINLCDRRKVLGVSCTEYHRQGAFAEFVVVPQHILYTLPDGMRFEQAAMVEALSIAVHAVNRTAPRFNDTALVMGSGIIGLLALQVLRIAGCSLIIAADTATDRLELALKLGADIALNPQQGHLLAKILEATSGCGVDVAIEAVGLTSSIQAAVSALRKGGTLTLIGNLSPHVELPLQTIVTGEISVNGSCASQGEYPVCLDLIARGAVEVDTLISATVPLADGVRWFQRLYRREAGLMKVILVP